jgi:hypothetical protein
VEALHKKDGEKMTKKRVKTRKNLGRRRQHDSAASSLDGLSEIDDDSVLDEVFASTDVRALVGYLKSSAEPLFELILESDRMLERSEDTEAAKSEHDVIKRRLKEAYCKSVDALQNIRSIATSQSRRRKTLSSRSVKNSGSVKRINHGTNVVDGTEGREKVVGSCSSKNVKPSRDDMEAQRQLHRQLLEKDSSSENDGGGNSQESPSAEEELQESQSASSGDEYNPITDRRDLTEVERSERKQSARRTKTKAGLCLISLS